MKGDKKMIDEILRKELEEGFEEWANDITKTEESAKDLEAPAALDSCGRE